MDMNDNLNSVGYDSDLDSGESDFDFGFNDEGNESNESMDSGNIDFDFNEGSTESMDSNDTDFGSIDNDDFNSNDINFGSTNETYLGSEMQGEPVQVDPNSPEALRELLTRVKSENNKIYDILTKANTSAYCNAEIINTLSDDTVKEAVRFAAGTTVLGGKLYYTVNDSATVICSLGNKTPSSNLSHTIIENLNTLCDMDLSDVKCGGCEKHRHEEYRVPLTDFNGQDRFFHDRCKCVIGTDGRILQEHASAGCTTCNGGGSVDDTSCPDCQKKAKDLEGFIAKVKDSLELQPGAGAGYEIENIIESVAAALGEIYELYAIQLKPPMGVLTDVVSSKKSTGEAEYSVACRGVKYKTSDTLPGTWDYDNDAVDYTGSVNNHMVNLNEMGAILKEAACQLYPLRTAGHAFVSEINNKRAGNNVPFFGVKDQLTRLSLIKALKWHNGKYLSDFSAGGWHSYHIFGRYDVATNTKPMSMYTTTKKVVEKDENGAEHIVEKSGELHLTQEIIDRLHNDIRTEIWEFLWSESTVRQAGVLPLECWYTPNHEVLDKYKASTLDQLLAQFDRLKQRGQQEDCGVVIDNMLRFMLCAVIDFLMTFVVVLDCNDATISFDLVYFEYNKFNKQTGAVERVSLGETVQGVLDYLVKGVENYVVHLNSLSNFRKNKLGNIKSVGAVSGYNSGGKRERIAGADIGLSFLGDVRVSRFITVLNPESYLGYPLFAYQPISRIQKLSGGLDSNNILVGETMDGERAELKGVMENDCDCISLFAASRSGKGVMTLAMLGTLLQSGNPVVYLDGKPEMSGVFVDFILSLNEIATKLGYTEDDLIKTFPAFEMYQPCTQAELKNKSSTYVTKMSKTVQSEMRKVQKSWLLYAENQDKVPALNALWAKYFYGEKIPSDIANFIVAPYTKSDSFFVETGVNKAFSYLFRMRAYYLFYAMMRVSTTLPGRIIVISDEINRCNIVSALRWLRGFYEKTSVRKTALEKAKKITDEERSELEQLGAGFTKFDAFVKEYFGSIATIKDGTIKVQSGENPPPGLTVSSEIATRQVGGSLVKATGDTGVNPLYILVGQIGNAVYCSPRDSLSGRVYTDTNGDVAPLLHRGKTLETYLMEKAVTSGICIQGNWMEQDSGGDYGVDIIQSLAACNEVQYKYLHVADDPDSAVSGFFAIRQKGGAPQIARTYLVLNNNTAEYTEDFIPGSERTKYSVRPRTRAAILGKEDKNKQRIAEVDDKLNEMLFRNYADLKRAGDLDKPNKKWKRDARVGFLGYFGMLLGVNLPDHVFAVPPTPPVEGVNEEQEDGKSVSFDPKTELSPEEQERFKVFYEKFRNSCNGLEAAFQAMPFVRYMRENNIRSYSNMSEFIYDFDPRSFVTLSVMLLTEEDKLSEAFAGGSDTPYREYAEQDFESVSSAVATDADSSSVANDDFDDFTMESLAGGVTTQPSMTPTNPLAPMDISQNTVANASRNTMNAPQNTTSTPTEFENEFNNVMTQLNEVSKFLKMPNYHSSFVTFEATQGDDSAMQLLHEVFEEANRCIDALYNRFETYLTDETGADSVRGKKLNALVSECNALSRQWESERQQYWSGH